MSGALAAARKRRGVVEPVVNNVTQNQTVSAPATGLTLPQVIALVDKRLTTLETFMKDSSQVSVTNNENNSNNQTSDISNDALKIEIIAIVEEFNNRYELLATEIQNLKDVVLKLQSYTMDVNKTLMEERIHVFSDLGKQNITINGEVDDSELESSENI